MTNFGFKRSGYDNCLFTKGNTELGNFLKTIIYVDDILTCGNDTKEIQRFKSHLHSLYIINDIGKATYIVGVEIV